MNIRIKARNTGLEIEPGRGALEGGVSAMEEPTFRVVVGSARDPPSESLERAFLRRGVVVLPALMSLVVVGLVAAASGNWGARGAAGGRAGALSERGWGEIRAASLAADAKMMRSLADMDRAAASRPAISLGRSSRETRFAAPGRMMNLGNPASLHGDTGSTQSLQGYSNHRGRFFRPADSSTFALIKLNNVDVTFLDKTNLKGYDAADMATLGKYQVMTRMGMIEHCNSANFNEVDGILGFGWADAPRSAALLKTLTQLDRPSWDLKDQPFLDDNHKPMPRKFTFTANDDLGELQLGGYDPKLVDADFTMFHMTGLNAYAIDIHSITYGGVELLHFAGTNHKKTFAGEFDSGTTCLLLPSSDVKGNFTKPPFSILREQQLMHRQHPLVYKARDIHGNVHEYEMAYSECVEPTEETMILGDPFFRKFVVLHDLVDLSNKRMGLALKNPAYRLGVWTDSSILVPRPENPRVFVTGGGVTRMHAKRKLRDAAFTQALHSTRKAMHAGLERSSLALGLGCLMSDCSTVDKVAVKSKTMITYEVQLAIGTPAQPLDVIFDTGSYMLAVFAKPPPAGMTPLLD